MSVDTEIPRLTTGQLRDVHLLDQIHAELRAHPYSVVRRVNCRVEGNRIVLSGNVGSFFEKQLAQEQLRRFLGPEFAITNDLQVTGRR